MQPMREGRDIPHQYSAICRLNLGTGDPNDKANQKWVIYDLPGKFKKAGDARDFTRTWRPNELLHPFLAVVEVCEHAYRAAHLDRWLGIYPEKKVQPFGPGPNHPCRRAPAR